MIRTAGAGVRSGRARSPGIRSPDPTSIVISSVRTSGTGVPGGTSGWHTTDLLWLGADATIAREHDGRLRPAPSRFAQLERDAATSSGPASRDSTSARPALAYRSLRDRRSAGPISA